MVGSCTLFYSALPKSGPDKVALFMAFLLPYNVIVSAPERYHAFEHMYECANDIIAAVVVVSNLMVFLSLFESRRRGEEIQNHDYDDY